MYKAITLFSTILALLLVLGCSGSDDSNVSSGSDSGTETSFNFTMTSYLSQETASPTSGTQADFTADQIMTGSLTATPSGGGTAQVFDWSIYFDETTWDVQSNKTIILAPGTYDFSLLITKGSQEYAGTATGVAISDGTFDVPMTISPVIGDTVTDVTLVASLADFKFQYNTAELSAASLTNPQMGIIVDGGTEEVFTINPSTGISDNYVNLPEGSHTVQLKLYNASLQVGRSITAQESVIITAGLDLAMDLVALHGETTFALTEAGGDANFQFNIPAEVVDEAGGLASLQVLFSMVGDNNPLEETELTLSEDASGDYEASVTLSNKQFDQVTISLTFIDTSVSEQLGSCVMETTLDMVQRTLNCDVTLRRRAIVGGSLLAALGINVLNEAYEPVAGAIISENGNILGITGSGAFGTEGYLKLLLVAGEYSIRAENSEKYGEISVAVNELGVSNDTIVLSETMLQPVLPDTEQITCYNSAGDTISCPAPGENLAQDGSYAGIPQQYQDNGDGTITDLNTKLLWQKEDDGTKRTLAEAGSYCSSLNLGGFNNWRLPNPKEIATILDLEVHFFSGEPTINQSYFPNTKSEYYWSTAMTGVPGDAYSVLFNSGSLTIHSDTWTIYVRCVRTPSDSLIWTFDYIDNGDGTISHGATGRVWQKIDDNVIRTWEESISYCESLDFAGFTDWRLPNVTELQSIVDYGRQSVLIDESFFPNTKTGYTGYWSSTSATYSGNGGDSAQGINFQFGKWIGRSKSEHLYTRCMRITQ